ncbi:Uncharacterised protein [Bordetella pertussis]|nr:Uncharacterised protein [Bordetella pertussis]
MLSPAFRPSAASSNSGSMRPWPSTNGKSSALPPSKGTPSIVPAKSSTTRSPSCEARPSRISNLARCLRSTSSVWLTSASVTGVS